MLSPGDVKNVRENRHLKMFDDEFSSILRFDGRNFVNLILFARGLFEMRYKKEVEIYLIFTYINVSLKSNYGYRSLINIIGLFNNTICNYLQGVFFLFH